MELLFDPEIIKLISGMDLKTNGAQLILGALLLQKILKTAKKKRKRKTELKLIQGGIMESEELKLVKAYDLKVLALRMKAVGMDVAEDALLKSYPVVKQWLKDSAALSQSPIDDVAISFVDQLDAIALPAIDKVDGKVG